ncbi:MAG: hypothetical protein EOP39_08295 [Rubrivivax sp.]|nr:MAG: hypothetical protein EOP39_08295 [Rubrivivax sp.]
MRRWFIALLALLVTAQLSWAGAALCCVEELSEHPTTYLSGGEATAQEASATDPHAVCGTAGHCHCHHTGCATPLADAAPPAASQRPTPEPALAPRVKSHIPQGLDRPNWLRA